MRSESRQTPWLLILGCFLLLAAGSYATVSEVRPYLSAYSSERTMVAAIASRAIRPGLSLQSQAQYLFDCRVAMTSLTGRAQPTATRSAIVRACLADSDALTAASPTFAVAWYTGAMAAGFAEDWPGLNTRLRRAYETAPHEQWVAELRVDLAEDHFAVLDPDLPALHEADLQMLLGFDGGRHFLAPRYLAFPALRGRIDAQLPLLDEAGQSRFRNIVDRLATQRSRTNGRS